MRRWLAGIAGLALLAPPAISAQTLCAPAAADSAAPRPDRPPDVVVRASVSARSVRFASRPSARVALLGCAGWDTLIVTERTNLPDPVEPGVTYRDVRVGVEIRSWLDYACLLPAGACATLLAPDSINRPRDR